MTENVQGIMRLFNWRRRRLELLELAGIDAKIYRANCGGPVITSTATDEAERDELKKQPEQAFQSVRLPASNSSTRTAAARVRLRKRQPLKKPNSPPVDFPGMSFVLDRRPI